MTYREFCNAVAPRVVEIEEFCSDMDESEFAEFKEKSIKQLCSLGGGEQACKLLLGLLTIIHDKLFCMKIA